MLHRLTPRRWSRFPALLAIAAAAVAAFVLVVYGAPEHAAWPTGARGVGQFIFGHSDPALDAGPRSPSG
jgi:hypothetical protein